MKVLIDLTYIKTANPAGVAIYAYRLIQGFRETGCSKKIFLLVTNENKLEIERQCPEFNIICLPSKFRFILNKVRYLTSFLYQFTVNQIVKKNEIDVFLTLYLNEASLTTSVVPQYVFLHDIQTFILKKNQKLKGAIYRLAMIRLLYKTSKIITGSEYSKKSILKVVSNISGSKIAVIYDSVFLPEEEKWDIIDSYKPYILNVNTIMPYKNLETLIRAFYALKDLIPHKLIIKGNVTPYWNEVIFPLIKKLKIENRIVLIDTLVKSEKMVYLYRNASLFVTPSLMEGFGFTPIEAAICKIPVISTKETALLETTLGLLNYYEPPLDYVKLSNVMLSALSQPCGREHLEYISSIMKEQYAPLNQAKKFMNLFQTNSISEKNIYER